jgi:putative NADPH-quinone reductase
VPDISEMPGTLKESFDRVTWFGRVTSPSSDQCNFAGALDYSKLSLLYRLIVKAMEQPEGDFRQNHDGPPNEGRRGDRLLCPAHVIGHLYGQPEACPP